jgi:hypothetical protein
VGNVAQALHLRAHQERQERIDEWSKDKGVGHLRLGAWGMAFEGFGIIVTIIRAYLLALLDTVVFSRKSN